MTFYTTPCVCDYAIMTKSKSGKEELLAVVNNYSNALLICDILNHDYIEGTAYLHEDKMIRYSLDRIADIEDKMIRDLLNRIADIKKHNRLRMEIDNVTENNCNE